MKSHPKLTAAGFAVIGAAGGFIARGFVPPIIFDDPFWRSFWTGPPAAGIFALLGAVVAFGAAAWAARGARLSARRNEWWERAEWALTQAMSSEPFNIDVGLAALEALEVEATGTESDMLAAVTTRRFLSTPPAGGIATASTGNGQ